MGGETLLASRGKLNKQSVQWMERAPTTRTGVEGGLGTIVERSDPRAAVCLAPGKLEDCLTLDDYRAFRRGRLLRTKYAKDGW